MTRAQRTRSLVHGVGSISTESPSAWEPHGSRREITSPWRAQLTSRPSLSTHGYGPRKIPGFLVDGCPALSTFMHPGQALFLEAFGTLEGYLPCSLLPSLLLSVACVCASVCAFVFKGGKGHWVSRLSRMHMWENVALMMPPRVRNLVQVMSARSQLYCNLEWI